MENNKKNINEELPSIIKTNFAENERRIFFKKSIGAILTSVLGLSVLNSFSQVRKATVNSKENLNSLYLPKKYISALDNNTIKSKIKKLDIENQILTAPHVTEVSNDSDVYLKENKDKYDSLIQIDCETGIIHIKADGKSVMKDIDISKIESQIEIDENYIIQNSKKLFPNKIESLLNQSADLLDRAIRDRSEWDDKANKFLEIALELQEFQKADDLLKKEVEAGYYKLEYKKAKVDLEMQEIIQMKAASAEIQMNKLISERFSPKALQEEQTNLRRMNTSYTFAGYHSGPGGEEPREHEINFDQTIASISEFVNSGSLAMNQTNFAIQQELNKIQLRQLEANEKTASKNKLFFSDKLKWEEKNISFKLEHDQIIRDTSCYKLASFLKDDGILNYIKRLIPLQQKFNNDFIESNIRLNSASIGLKAIYDYEAPLPTFRKNYVQFFDDCIIWNRKAINFINSSTQNQIATTIPVSIRSLYKNLADFNNSYTNGKWKFNIDENFFKDKFQVKMLGLSLSVIGLSKDYKEPFNLDGCFQAKMVIPKKESAYMQKSGKKTTLDLSEYLIPDICIGNVYSNESSHNSEIVGSQILSNLSPIGEWTISLLPTSRTFVYEKRKNGRVRKTSLIRKNAQFDFNNSEEVVTENSLVDVQSSKEASNHSYVDFIPTDFWDLKLDIHVAYLT